LIDDKVFSKGLLFDASPVIDFASIDKNLFNLVKNNIGNLYINDYTVTEVGPTIEESFLIKYGFTILNNDNNILPQELLNKGKLSLSDKYCIFKANILGLTCVTTDKQMIKYCEFHKINVIWEFKLLEILFDKNILTYDECEAIIYKLSDINRYFTNILIKKNLNNLKNRT
jgi:hypothetical protein